MSPSKAPTAFATAAIALAAVAAPSGCSCKSRCERDIAQFERRLEAREAELAELLESSEPVRIELEGGEDPPEHARRVLVTGEGIHRERIHCVATLFRAEGAQWERDCREAGGWPYEAPPSPQPVQSVDAIGPFLRGPVEAESLCVPQSPVLYVGRDAARSDVAAVASVWPEDPVHVLARTGEGMRVFAVGVDAVLSTAEHGARQAARVSDDAPASLDLRVTLTKAGVTIGGSGGVLAPGCEETTSEEPPPPTVPASDGRHDASAVRRCVTQVKREFRGETTVTLLVGDASTRQTVAMLAAVTSDADGRDLFPDVTLVVD